MCASIDSIGSATGEPRAPEAGAWFVPQLVELSCRSVLNDPTSSGACDPVVEAVGLTRAHAAAAESANSYDVQDNVRQIATRQRPAVYPS